MASASGSPEVTYQWFEGVSGDTRNPVDGAVFARFVSPVLVRNTRFWAQATNVLGSVDSGTYEVTAFDSTLTNLTVNGGALSPRFNPSVLSYEVAVPESVVSLEVTATFAEDGRVVTVDGIPATSGVAVTGFPLVAGLNTFAVEVVSTDGSLDEVYTLNVERLAVTTLATGEATEVNFGTADLAATVVPNGTAEVFFEYGLDTSYGFTSGVSLVTGTNEQTVVRRVSGLEAGATYHYRAVAEVNGVSFFGEDRTFVIGLRPAIALTGEGQALVGTEDVVLPGVNLTGAVDPQSLETEVFFEYGLTPLLGLRSASVTLAAETGLTDIRLPVGDLLEGATYFFRVIAANDHPDGRSEGALREFEVGASLPEPTIPTAAPLVTTGGVSGVAREEATLLGEVNASGGTTAVRFEYGLDTNYGLVTNTVAIGNTDTAAAIAIAAENLLVGTTYHYRITATNSLGTSVGQDATFTTFFNPPLVVTGEAVEVDSTTVLVDGVVTARGTPVEVFFDFGTSPFALDQSVQALPAMVAANGENVAVSAELTGLQQGVRYFYRIRAVSTESGAGLGRVEDFNVALLSGLEHVYPVPVPLGERDTEVQVDLTFDGSPAGSGSGWRFLGEIDWRNSGTVATGLTTGARILEFRPVPGFAQPESEAFSLTEEDDLVVLTRDYDSSEVVGAGSLRVNLSPDLAASNGRWRFAGEGDAAWRASGVEVSDLVPGSYVIETEPVASLATPLPVSLRVFDGQQSATTVTYFPAEDVVGTEPVELTFEEISVVEEFPFPWVGQLSSEIGRGSGFVVRPCVVATVAHVVFDDNTLSTVTDLRWLFQLHKGEHEPEPQVPRGFYLMTGYAAQREVDIAAGVPEGESSVQSQNLDVATLYFNEDAGRGGFSGYLASDLEENEFITSTDPKILVGYPVDGIPEAGRDRMYATPPLPVALNSNNTFGQTYTTSEIRSTGGTSGGPLCVLANTGTFHPAALYLGGTAQTVVRAFDSDVVQLFGFAEASCDLAEESGGVFTTTESTQTDFPSQGVLQVRIEPELARVVGAGWRINALDDFLASDEQLVLEPGSYVIQISNVPGFVSPIPVPVELTAGGANSVVFSFADLNLPPEITSSTLAELTFGQRIIPSDETSPFQQVDYQITTEPEADVLALSGVLPAGVVFDATTGELSGVPAESGLFEVILGASNDGGADSQGLVILIRPTIERDQVATFAPEVLESIRCSAASREKV